MKLLIAVINSDDSHVVLDEITKAGFYATKLSTTGGFLRAGNVTVLVGVDADRVQTVIDIIARYSRSRKQVIPTTSEAGINFYPSMPVEVVVGGATIFVLDVERFEKV